MGIYTPYDLSLWCAERGLLSVYLERKKKSKSHVFIPDHPSPSPAQWLVKDSQCPGKIIQKFVVPYRSKDKSIRMKATAWLEEQYGISYVYLPLLKSSFNQVAVDMLIEDLQKPVVEVKTPALKASVRLQMAEALKKEIYSG